MISRREVLALMVGSTTSAFAQGISTRSVKPQPRGKPSGRPFLARFTDIARPAGLTAPVIYGGIDSKNYIIEVVGCGVAFIDYDNDGWQDLLVLNGTRIEGAPAGTTNSTTSTPSRSCTCRSHNWSVIGPAKPFSRSIVTG